MKNLILAAKRSSFFIPNFYQLSSRLNERLDLIFYNRQKEDGIGAALNFDDEDWEHLFFGIEFPKGRCPTYEEMSAAKEMFWDKEEIVMQVHPTKQEYVNINPYMLHLWRDKTMTKFQENMLMNQIKSAYKKAKLLGIKGRRNILVEEGGFKKLIIFCGNRWLSWDEVCKVKLKFFGEDKAAVQFNISKEIDLNSEHIIILWDADNFKLPPKRLV